MVGNDESDGQAQKTSPKSWPPPRFLAGSDAMTISRGYRRVYRVVVCCHQRKDNREIVGGAERYPGPHGKTTRGVESSITTAGDQGDSEHSVLENIVCKMLGICFQADRLYKRKSLH